MPPRYRIAYIAFSLALTALGVFIAYEGYRLSLGTLSRIGPGFFPLVLGVLIAVLSFATIFEDATHSDTRFNLRGLVLVSGSLFFFAATVERLGLAVAVTGAVVLTSLAMGRPRWTTALLVSAVLCTLAYFFFVNVLRLPLRPFPDVLSLAG
jgi:hypothetical protein